MDPTPGRSARDRLRRARAGRGPAGRGELPGDRGLERDRLRTAVHGLGRSASRADAVVGDERIGRPRLRRQRLQGQRLHPRPRAQSGRSATGRTTSTRTATTTGTRAISAATRASARTPATASSRSSTRRTSRPSGTVARSNLVVISTCENGNANTTMPGAFGIAKSKAKELDWNGPEFYLGYLGDGLRQRRGDVRGRVLETRSRRARASVRRSTWRCSRTSPTAPSTPIGGAATSGRDGQVPAAPARLRLGGLRCHSCCIHRSSASVADRRRSCSSCSRSRASS